MKFDAGSLTMDERVQLPRLKGSENSRNGSERQWMNKERQ